MRLLPGSKPRASKLSNIAGSCRFVLNRFLEDIHAEWKAHVDDPENCPTPSVTHFSLCRRYTDYETPEWFATSSAIVRKNLVKLADTWKQFFKTHGVSGRPRVQSKSRNGVTFNVCCSGKGTQWIVDDMLNVPGAGRYRMRGSNCYSDWKLTDYTIYKEIGKWYVCLRYKEEVPVEPAYDSKAVGIDLGVDKTVVASDGTVYVENNPNKTKAQKRIKWYQKTLARQQKGSNRRKKTKRRIGKLHKKVANIRTDFAHQTTKKITDTCDVVVMEDLNLTNMTKSAKGTVDDPGKNVKAKSGLNRAILDAALGSIREKLTYKSKKIVLVNLNRFSLSESL